jgi:hypothetical protein
MHPAGVMPVIVANVNDLANINKDKEGVIISSSVGKKKKIAILTKAKELSLKVLNVKDSDKYIASVTDQLKARKDEKEKKQKKRAEKKAEKKDDKKGKKEEGLADKVVTEEEKSAQEKKEKDKVLTKKEI